MSYIVVEPSDNEIKFNIVLEYSDEFKRHQRMVMSNFKKVMNQLKCSWILVKNKVNFIRDTTQDLDTSNFIMERIYKLFFLIYRNDVMGNNSVLTVKKLNKIRARKNKL